MTALPERLDLPSFLVIGAMKSGTTALYSLLCSHPHIRMSSIKEPHFFNSPDVFGGTWNHGLEWYLSLFPPGPGVRGEASTGYTKFPRDAAVVDRIHETLPQARFVYLVRNPIDRALSHYLHSVLDGLEERPIHRALLELAKGYYVTTGLYALQLAQYLRWYPRERFCILVSESFWRDRAAGLRHLHRFLGVDEILPETFPTEKRRSTERRLRSFLGRSTAPRNEAQRELLGALGPCALGPQWDAAAIAGSLGFGLADRRALADRFREDVGQLSRILERQVVEWRCDFSDAREMR